MRARVTAAVLPALLCCATATAQVPAAAPAPADTGTARVDTTAARPPLLRFPASPFERTAKAEYLGRHAYSFDHYLQFEPGLVVARRGPIGADAFFSRFGVGRGRGVVVYDGVVMNDPQNGIAPLPHVPVSVLGAVSTQGTGGDVSAIEGVVRIEALPPPPRRPRTFLELSKGTNDLRQRRVYFSSADAPVGIDLSYDELLNDGYNFDATETVGLSNPQFGASTSRQYGVRLRGRFADGGRYSAGLREFTSSFNGDLVSSSRELRRSGHLATATASAGPLGLLLFQRGFTADYPDSLTENTTTAARATLRFGGGRRSLTVTGGVEDIVSLQRVAGAESRPDVTHTSAGVEALARIAGAGTMRAWARGADYHGVVSQWGAGVGLRGEWARWFAGAEARRNFRMPTLGELYLPAHVDAASGHTVSGNKYLDAEYSWEGSGHVGLSAAGITVESRATGIRVEDPVEALPQTVGGETWYVPGNTGAARLYVFEERVRARVDFRGLQLRAAGAATFTTGDRAGFFASSPRSMVHASLRIGGAMFEATSALFAGVDYTRSGERTGYAGTPLPAWEVVNFTLDGRLLDANMYLALLNALDTSYRTEGNYLMTPRTFVYGIAWTLWE